MKVYNAVVHHNNKKREEKSSTNKCAIKTLEKNDQLLSLVRDIDDHYRKKSSKAFGSFTEGGLFSPKLREYIDQKNNKEKEFMAFTSNVMDIFSLCINAEYLASGGYLLFVHYSCEEKSSFMIAMLDHKQGALINSDLTISPAVHLDISGLHVAAKIEIDEWLDNSEYYLSFVLGGRQYISKYFSTFIGCLEQIDSKKESEKLLKVINEFCVLNKFDVEKSDIIRQKVHDYCSQQQNANDLVYLGDLTTHIFPKKSDQQGFYDFITQDEYKLSDCFSPHMRTLKKLKTFTYKSVDLNISFSRHIYANGGIFYDQKKKILRVKVDQKLHEQLMELEDDV